MTPHIESRKEDISDTVIMPGDPLRAKFIAEHYLEDARLINSVRNCLAYTGKYKGKEVTVFASGMGIPSIGIYAYELYKFYDVKKIIRIGTCGTYQKELNLFDLILVSSSVSESNFGKVFGNDDSEKVDSSAILNQKLIEASNLLNKHLSIGNIYCSEAFYSMNSTLSPLVSKYQCLGVEMESFALFHIAKQLNKEASCLLAVSDSVVSKEETTSEEREKGLTDLIEVALTATII